MGRRKPTVLNILSNGVILFIVYTAFCDSVEGRIWEHYGLGLTIEVLAGVIALFTTISLFVWAISNAAGLERDDFVAALFCSVKKTLAMGIPLAQLIFGAKADLGLILLPIMFYHPFQLFVCGLLANSFANTKRQIWHDRSLSARNKLGFSLGTVRQKFVGGIRSRFEAGYLEKEKRYDVDRKNCS